MLDDLTNIAAELRQLGIALSIDQQTDAARALAAIDPIDRAEVYAALGSTLVRREDHLRTLQTVLDIVLDSNMPSSMAFAEMDDDALQLLLRTALRRLDKKTLRIIAAEATKRHSGFASGRAVAGTYYVTRTLRWLNLDAAEQDLISATSSSLDILANEELKRQRSVFMREAVDSAVRSMLIADRGLDELIRLRRAPLVEEIDILHASADQLKQLDRAILPLARRLARQFRAKSSVASRPDMRTTFRRAMANGGVIFDIVPYRQRKKYPNFIVLADVSGSVASFAKFTLSLLRALSQNRAHARYFAFVDGIADVTAEVTDSEGALSLADLLGQKSELVRGDGRSDYGFAFRTFFDRWGALVDSETIVLIIGDGRNNTRAPNDEALAAISSKARRVYWLNPEAPENWGMGDSAIPQYRAWCTNVVQCRNLGQLQRFVAALA